MRWLLPAVLLTALGAWAHDADVIYVLVKQGPEAGVLVESVTLTGATLAFLAPLDADGDQLLTQADLDAKPRALRAGFWDEVPLLAAGKRCDLLEAAALLREGFVELQGRFRCDPGELRQDFRILRVLPANYRVVLGSQLEGENRGGGFAQGSLTTIPVPRPLPPGSWDGAAFRAALDRGVQRGLGGEVLGALLAVLIAIGRWRRGLLASALMLAAVVPASFAELDGWAPAILLLILAAGAALKTPPLVVPLLLGVAIGVSGGGGGWPSALGLGLGTVLVLLFASPLALALGVLLQRRPGLLRWARWVPVAAALLALVLRARLSW